ncbi:MAG TPA: AtpZ/AtpI family protein [Patescibacteria group bacterium]
MDSKNKSNIPWWQPGLVLFVRLSGWIAGPIIVAVFVGKFLDKKYHSEPWLFLLSVGIAFLISMIALIKIGFAEFKKIEKEDKKK